MSRPHRGPDPAERSDLGGWLLPAALSFTATVGALAWIMRTVAGNRMAPWILGRASGILAYSLLVVLTGSGLLLSHPWRSRVRVPAPPTRIRVHALLAALAGGALLAHIIVLATDRYAGVGWLGSVLPGSASYRPFAVALGIIAGWMGILTAGTAALAARLPLRAWWPIHKVAAGIVGLTWLHALLAGSDAAALRWLYLISGAGLLLVGFSRYTTRTPADELAELGQ